MSKLNYFEIPKEINEWHLNFRCPFGVRDLSVDECYSGNGVNRCKYFVKYSWSPPYDHHLVCSCNLPIVGVKKVIQLTFDF